MLNLCEEAIAWCIASSPLKKRGGVEDFESRDIGGGWP